MRALFLVGRTLFGGFFLYNGYNHLRNVKQLAPYAESKGVPTPHAAVQATGAMLVGGGLSVILGCHPRQGLATLIAFLIPTTLQMHRFWEHQDPQQRMNEQVNFSKNLALTGAALALMQLNEPWPTSVDEALHEDEEMFVRLGGRDLRSLPA